MSEATLTNKCRTLFKDTKKAYPDFYFLKVSDRYCSGVPDFYLCYRGQSAWVELKATGKKPSKLQLHTLEQIQRSGAISVWTDSFKKVEQLVNLMLRS